mmetsp:Transcript_904/g.1954  ORF Transcript_904/g.1954 Transcript_904/m.1954 type:complete len:243 (-) Transcript_904:317-1045(-)
MGSAMRALEYDGGVKRWVAMDPSEGMLQRARQRYEGRAEFWCVDEEEEENWPVEHGSMDLVVSNLALHWVNDLPGVLLRMNRILRRDGFLLATMLGGETIPELRIALQLAEQEVWGGVSPRVSPFVRLRDAGSVLGRANFVLTTIDIDHITVPYPDMETLMKHLQGMGENNAAIARRPHIGRTCLRRASEIYKERFSSPDGSVVATFQVIHMAGWTPHPEQQAPAARGSATIRIPGTPTTYS